MRKADLQRLLKTSATSPLGQVQVEDHNVIYDIVGVKISDITGNLTITVEYNSTHDPNYEPDVIA